MRQRPKLLGHREAVLAESSFRRQNRQVQRVREVRLRERDDKRDPKARAVELIDRDDHERSGLRLLGSTSRIGIRPHDIALPYLRAQ